MNAVDLEQAAAHLAAARVERQAMEELPFDLRPRSPEDAYALQARLHEQLRKLGRGEVAGHKIGCTTQVMQDYLRIPHPCAGGILESTVHRGEGGFEFTDFVRVGVECELAVTLGADLPGIEDGYDQTRVAHAVAQVMAAIEVVDDRWSDFTEVSTPSLIADDFFAAGCVLGEPLTQWRESPQTSDLAATTGRMAINGDLVGEGSGADILGHPLQALAWLANARVERGAPLRAGEFVLLGSVVKTCWLNAGDEVQVEVDGLGGVRARFR